MNQEQIANESRLSRTTNSKQTSIWLLQITPLQIIALLIAHIAHRSFLINYRAKNKVAESKQVYVRAFHRCNRVSIAFLLAPFRIFQSNQR